MIPPLLVVVLGIAQLSFNLLVPLLLLEEAQASLVLFASPLGETTLGLALLRSSLFLEFDEALELFDTSLNSLGFRLGLGADDLSETAGVFAFCPLAVSLLA